MNKQIAIHLYNGHGLSNKNFTDAVMNSHSLIIFVKKSPEIHCSLSRQREDPLLPRSGDVG